MNKSLAWGGIAAVVCVVILIEMARPKKAPQEPTWEIQNLLQQDRLRVRRLGPIYRTIQTADGTIKEEEHWEATVVDTGSDKVFFIRLTPDEEIRWRLLTDEIKRQANEKKR